MKRATKAVLERIATFTLVDRPRDGSERAAAQDALDSDARQRAEIRELRAACRHFNFAGYPERELTEGEIACTRALARRRRR